MSSGPSNTRRSWGRGVEEANGITRVRTPGNPSVRLQTIQYPLFTGLVALTTRSATILLGIFVTFAITAALCVRYPKLVWGDGTASVASGVFGGGAVFGGMVLGDALGTDFHFGAAMFGLGLATFGLATGYWLADSNDVSPASSVDTEA